MKILYGVLASASGLSAMVAVDIYRRWYAPFHSYKAALDHYLVVVGLSFLGKRMRNKLDKDATRNREVQEEFLLKQIQKNKDTFYGKDFGLNRIKSREEFVKLHPLTTYANYEPYVQRVAKGEEKVMLPGRPAMLAMTSGTSGKSRMLPWWKEQSSFFFIHAISIAYDTVYKYFPGAKNLQKSMKIFYTPRWRESEAGLPIGPNSSSPTSSKHALAMYSTPKAGFDIMSEPEATYVHLLFGLKDRNLGVIEANFVSLIHTALVKMSLEWEQLVTDIEQGFVHEGLNIDYDIKIELNKLMKPDPERAAELRREFTKGFDGIVKRIWPRLNMILAVDTGTFEIYGKILQSSLCAGVPFHSPIYACTEGLIGLNLTPERPDRQYLLYPRSMFFEFIPVENMGEEQPKTLFADEVEIGQTYELVITNQGGLYRYRFGDVVKVVDLYRTTPLIEFQYRKGQLLNVRGEKISEDTLYKALQRAEVEWSGSGVKVIDYCCAEHVVINAANDGKSPEGTPSYTIFLELGESGSSSLTAEQRNMIDQHLQDLSFVYKSFRIKDSIGPIKVHLVKPGTFLELRDFMIKTSLASSNQYKVPRVMRRTDAVEFLLERTVE